MQKSNFIDVSLVEIRLCTIWNDVVVYLLFYYEGRSSLFERIVKQKLLANFYYFAIFLLSRCVAFALSSHAEG